MMKKKNRKKIRELIHQSVPSKIRLKSLQLAPGGRKNRKKYNVKDLMP